MGDGENVHNILSEEHDIPYLSKYFTLFWQKSSIYKNK